MAITVKEIAQLSGVSVRTLHWYDQIGILPPSYIGANGYRYYEQEQLLILQHILFFKELGFGLNDIKQLLKQSSNDKIKTLQAHKKVLQKEIYRKQELMNTLDKTILHLKGETIMKDEELYIGFDRTKQKEYEMYIVQAYGTKAEDRLRQCHKRTAKWDQHVWDDVKQKGDQVHRDLAKMIDKKFPPNHPEVQKIIQRHYELQNRFFDLDQEVYLGLGDLYRQHPDFKKFFDGYHSKMPEYLQQAIQVFARDQL